ncbi:MAG: cysteine synthase A [Bacteriovoracaceae bacterium]|nr:cysteine synthase A [Bacteriovoracaceae bacterium]
MITGLTWEAIGKTPLIKLESLSKHSGCEIFGKAEFLNPGGSVKDRTALGIISEAREAGLLKPGYTIIEGTAGNTGIGLATIAPQMGYCCKIVMPNNQSQEKYDILKALGAEVIMVPPCPFANENHFYHTAMRLAQTTPQSFWANQFENTANYRVHYQTTGPEIWEQLKGQVDAFVSAVGTGGTIGGVSKFLKEKNPKVHIRLADPLGSGLYSYIKEGAIASAGSSITEGIGIMRLTENFKAAVVDDAFQVTDQNMLSTVYHLAKCDGLLVGTSAGINVFAAYQYAMENKNSGKKIVTILCDSALRYQSKLFNEAFLKEKGLVKNLLF